MTVWYRLVSTYDLIRLFGGADLLIVEVPLDPKPVFDHLQVGTDLRVY